MQEIYLYALLIRFSFILLTKMNLELRRLRKPNHHKSAWRIILIFLTVIWKTRDSSPSVRPSNVTRFQPNLSHTHFLVITNRLYTRYLVSLSSFINHIGTYRKHTELCPVILDFYGIFIHIDPQCIVFFFIILAFNPTFSKIVQWFILLHL